MEVSKKSLLHTMRFALQKTSYPNYEYVINAFSNNYNLNIEKFNEKDTNDIEKYYRLITEFKPTLAQFIKAGPLLDELCDIAIQSFTPALNRVRGQLTDELNTNNSDESLSIRQNNSNEITFFCKTCQQEFDIPHDFKKKLLNSVETIELPTHHGQPMQIKISKTVQIEQPKSRTQKIIPTIYSAELLMGHVSSVTSDSHPEYLIVTSVGIDVGSSTSHLIYSRLTLKRETSFFNISNRYMLANRDILYESEIIITPLLDRLTIDMVSLIDFIEREYQKAGFSKTNIDTGAVIVTGETAKKQNALELVSKISSESGKFVSATAGRNFEAVLGALGSGIVDVSKNTNKTIMNVDIGGGSSKIAIISNGSIISTASISVGGRLLGIDTNFKIWKIDEPANIVMNYLGMNYTIGNTIPEQDIKLIAKELVGALLEVMSGPTKNVLTKKLLMTDDLVFSDPIDSYSFSGGISEFIYQKENNFFNDIGQYIAYEVLQHIKERNYHIIEPQNKIRATVIGAGAFSLSISGSTCYVDKTIHLPLLNVPVIPIQVNQENFSKEKIIEEIAKSLKQYDLLEGKEVIGLYFKKPIYYFEKLLVEFAKALELALINSISSQIPIILLFEMDLARMLGLTIIRETSIQHLVCLDELSLQAGDWIDIGEPVKSGDAYPVTVKSLAFKKKNSSLL